MTRTIDCTSSSSTASTSPRRTYKIARERYKIERERYKIERERYKMARERYKMAREYRAERSASAPIPLESSESSPGTGTDSLTVGRHPGPGGPHVSA